MEGNVLTKEEILKGREVVREVEIEDLGIVKIRPLTLGERSQVEALQFAGIKASQRSRGMTGGRKIKDVPGGNEESQEMTMDMDRFMSNKFKSEAMTVAFGLSCDGNKYSPDEIMKSKLSASAFQSLLQEIQKLSGLGNEEVVENVISFPEERRESSD